MTSKTTATTLTLGAALTLTGAFLAPALAEVPDSVAARLGQDLTPMGAERAGNAAGTIPAWSGRGVDNAPALLAGFEGGPLPDPYAGDSALYTITADNMAQHAAVLTDGHRKLFATYPSTYSITVYPTRRSCVYPDFVYKAAQRNAMVGRLVDNGNGISEAIMASPFPIPSNGLEIVWNHTLRYRGQAGARDYNAAVPTVAGDYVLSYVKDEFTFPYSDPQNRRAEDLNNISIYFVAHTSAPARRAGNVVLVHETLNMAKEGRKAWTYNPGTRRVRRAPNIAYDNPMTNGDGIATSDQYDGYNGAPDRYDWTVVGKTEKLSQQNNYRAVMTPYESLLQPGHANPEAMRYELRRHWVVEGNLRSTARHIYSRRVKYMEEDSWQLSSAELYDGRGELWRVQEAGQGTDYREHAQICFTTGGEFIYDTLAGRYMGLAMKSGRPANEVNVGLERLTPDYFTPANVRRLGR